MRAASCELRLATCEPGSCTVYLSCELSTISMGEDLPVRFFCALSKRAQRYYLKLSIKGQHPNNKFRRLLCAFIWGTQVIYPSSLNNQVARPTVRRAQVSTRMSHLAVHHFAGRRTQYAGRRAQLTGRRTQLAAQVHGTRARLAGRRDAARSSQLACPNRNSIHKKQLIQHIWGHGERFDVMEVFDDVTHYLMPWHTFWRHDELFNVMMCSLLQGEFVVVMMYFITCLYCPDILFHHFANKILSFDVMTNFLTSWCVLYFKVNLLLSWRISWPAYIVLTFFFHHFANKILWKRIFDVVDIMIYIFILC